VPPQVPLATLIAATGLGFGAETARCGALASTPLASVDDVIACLDRATVCRASALVATRVPRAPELLAVGGVGAAAPPCLPQAGEPAGALGDSKIAGKPLLKCERAVTAASAKLATRLAKGYGACAAAMRACVQSADTATCLAKASAKCAKAAGALPTVTGAPDTKLLAAVTKACGALAPSALASSNGLGFGSATVRCAALGVPALDGPAALATCITREHACRTTGLLEAWTPRLREHLVHAGIALD
jgi:hypothetical protein